MRRSKPTFVFLWVALACAVAAGACSINSQPVPPGAQAVGEDGGPFSGGGDGAFGDAGAPPKGEDGGITGTPPDAGNETDGGETDAGDGGGDGGGDDAGDDGGDGG